MGWVIYSAQTLHGGASPPPPRTQEKGSTCPIVHQWALHPLAECPLPCGASLGHAVLLPSWPHPKPFRPPFSPWHLPLSDLVCICMYVCICMLTYLFGCVGSSLQHTGSSSHHAGSSVAAHGLPSWGVWAQQFLCTDLVAPRHVGS